MNLTKNLRIICLVLAVGGILPASGCYTQVAQVGDLPVVVQPIGAKPGPQPVPSKDIHPSKRTHPVALVGKVQLESGVSEWIVKARVKNIYIRPVRRVYIQVQFFDASGSRLKLKQSMGIRKNNDTEDAALCVIEGNTLQPDEERAKSWVISHLSGVPMRTKASVVAVLFEDGTKWTADPAFENIVD